MRSIYPGRAAFGRGVPAAVFGCALLLLLVAAQSASAGAWLPPQDLSGHGRAATNPAVAMSDSGATTALWEKENFANPNLHGEASTRNPGEAFSAPAELGPGVTKPRVAMTADGRTIAVWERFDAVAGHYLIETATRPPGGAFQPASVIKHLPENVIPNGLALAVNDSGDTAVVWISRDPDSAVDKSATFVEATVRPAGGSFSEPEPISLPTLEAGRSAVDPSVAIDAGGKAVVVWRYFDGTNTLIEASDRGAGGSFSPPEVISTEGEDSSTPDVAIDDGGEATAVWSELEGEFAIIKASVRPDGGVFGAPDPISLAGESSGIPQIAMTPAGAATVVWVREGEAEDFVEASRRPAGGSFPATPDELTPDGEPGGPINPDLAVDPAGDAVVAWSGSTQKGVPVVMAAVRSGAGAFSAPREISAPSPDLLGFPHPEIAIDAVGNATVVWVMSDGADLIAQAAGYDATPPQMRGVTVPATGTVGVPVSFSADPFDVWPLASTGFSFGDGAGASGTSASHAYAAPGVYLVTATAVDAAGAAASGSGTIAISPSYEFRIGKRKINKKKGTATLTVEVSGPGEVAVSGKTVKRTKKRAAGAGSVTLPITPKGKAKKQLGKKGKAKIKVTVAFTPDGGDHSATSAVSLTLKKKNKRK